MLQDLFAPFVGRLVLGALSLSPFLVPGGSAFLVEPLHVALRIEMDCDGEVTDFHGAPADGCGIFGLSLCDQGGCGEERFVAHQEHLAEADAWATCRDEVNGRSIQVIHRDNQAGVMG